MELFDVEDFARGHDIMRSALCNLDGPFDSGDAAVKHRSNVIQIALLESQMQSGVGGLAGAAFAIARWITFIVDGQDITGED